MKWICPCCLKLGNNCIPNVFSEVSHDAGCWMLVSGYWMLDEEIIVK